jgi:hypothetical protein
MPFLFLDLITSALARLPGPQTPVARQRALPAMHQRLQASGQSRSYTFLRPWSMDCAPGSMPAFSASISGEPFVRSRPHRKRASRRRLSSPFRLWLEQPYGQPSPGSIAAFLSAPDQHRRKEPVPYTTVRTETFRKMKWSCECSTSSLEPSDACHSIRERKYDDLQRSG